jgi:DNA repair photolyase
MDHDFEDIEVKAGAVEILENTLKKKRRKGMIATGAMMDPYMPLEADLKIMRQCLIQISRFEFGLVVQTKSDLIMRDIDLLEEINAKTKCVVAMTLTTADEELCKKIEPNVCTTARRFEVLKAMRDRGIPTIVWLDPILPYINDTEENIRALLDYCIEAKVYGIMYFGAGMTLRDGSRQYYYSQLDRLFPGLTERYIKEYKDAYEVMSPQVDKLNKLVYNTCEENGIVYDKDELHRYMREYKNNLNGEQLSLF